MKIKNDTRRNLAISFGIFVLILMISIVYLLHVKTILEEDTENNLQALCIQNAQLMQHRAEENNLLLDAIEHISRKAILANEETVTGDSMKIWRISQIVCVVIVSLSAIASIYTIVLQIIHNKSIYHTVYMDALTNLPNKEKHKEDVQSLLENGGYQYVYVSIAVDNFKFMNEMLGYTYGDHVLESVAACLKTCLKPEEEVARVVGARFGMLLTYGEEAAFRKRLTDIMKQASDIPDKDKNHLYTITFSAGVYVVQEEKRVHVICEYAGVAREAAAQLFENSIEFYNEEIHSKRLKEKQLEYDLQYAIEHSELEVYLQPKYWMQTGKLAGAEALIRWKHAKKGFISPEEFIPISEANHSVIKIDMFVLEEVCKVIHGWLAAKKEPIPISVNLSRIHLNDDDVVQKLSSIVDRYDIPHELIEFELTETAVYEGLDNLLVIMNELKEEGFLISMDDFGSGYSSLNILKHLPIDILKLDKGLLGNFDHPEESVRDKTILTHIISMAKDLEMEVLAEGVETKAQAQFLKDAHCGLVQGYYYAKPMPLDEFHKNYFYI